VTERDKHPGQRQPSQADAHPRAIRQVARFEKGSREEQAERTLKHTRVSRGVAVGLSAVLVATIGSELVIQHVVEIRQNLAARQAEAAGGASGEARTSIWPRCYGVVQLLPSIQEIRQAKGLAGYWGLLAGEEQIREFADSLKAHSVLTNWVRPPVQSLLTDLGGAGNEKVYCGREGWLFYRPDVDYLTGPGFLDAGVLRRGARAAGRARQGDPRKAIVHFRDQLKARGIELIVMPAPLKPAIVPEHLSGRYDPSAAALQNPSYGRFLADLAAEGVLVFDASRDLVAAKLAGREEPFLRTDTHWTPQAMELAAQRLAEFIRSSKLLPPGPATAAAAYSRKAMAVANQGDIAAMLEMPAGQSLLGPQEVTIRQVLGGDGQPWQPTRSADVLLLGDSFVNVYSLDGMGWGQAAGFAEQLSCELARPLDRIALNAGGANTSRQELARALPGGQDRLAGKKLVIYEFAMRDLAAGDWRMIDLPSASASASPSASRPAPAGTMVPATSQGAEVVVEGRISAIARTPRPRTVPYKDCIVELHLVDLRVVAGKMDRKELAVFTWGMRNNQWTAAASWAVGQKVTMQVLSWASVEAKYDSYRRVELGEEMETPDIFWGQPRRAGPKEGGK
jgi:hypothetical protein